MQRFSQSDPSPHSCQRVTFSCLSRPAGVAATEYRTNSDVTIVRCTNIVPIESCRNACWWCVINWQIAEDYGVVIHNPLALTHTLIPCRPAYPEAWRQFLHYIFDLGRSKVKVQGQLCKSWKMLKSFLAVSLPQIVWFTSSEEKTLQFHGWCTCIALQCSFPFLVMCICVLRKKGN